MAFIPVPDTVEVVLRFGWAGQVVSITLSFHRPGGVAPTDMDNLNLALKTWHGTSVKTGQNTLIALTNIASTDISSATGPTRELPIIPIVFGTQGGGSVQNNVSLVTSFLTDLRGRSYRGRAYPPGLPLGGLSDSVSVTTGTALFWVNAFAALNAAVSPDGFEHVVVSRFTGGAPRVTGVATPVTQYRTEVFLDSQRRRLYGRGI